MIGSTLSRLGCVLIGHVYPVQFSCSLRRRLSRGAAPCATRPFVPNMPPHLAPGALAPRPAARLLPAVEARSEPLTVVCPPLLSWLPTCQVYKTFKSFKLSDDPSELGTVSILTLVGGQLFAILTLAFTNRADDAQLNDLRRILSYWAVMG